MSDQDQYPTFQDDSWCLCGIPRRECKDSCKAAIEALRNYRAVTQPQTPMLALLHGEDIDPSTGADVYSIWITLQPSGRVVCTFDHSLIALDPQTVIDIGQMVCEIFNNTQRTSIEEQEAIRQVAERVAEISKRNGSI